ncbi:MAG: helix-turn-helix domain-containing protein [archaeon]
MEELKEAGLTGNESKVYLALLDLGPSLAGQISRRTGLHRRTVYDVTEMLIKKGLIGYILRNNRRLFQASPPSKFLDIIKEKENLIQPIVKSLEIKYAKTREKEETNFYKGKEGLKTVFEDQLKSKDILILGASPKAYEVLQFYFKWYDKTRKERKIQARIIAQDRKIKRIPLAKIRYLPEKYANPVSVNIYGDKTAIILWASQPYAIVIKSKEVSEGYRNYFELMWKIAKN